MPGHRDRCAAPWIRTVAPASAQPPAATPWHGAGRPWQGLTYAAWQAAHSKTLPWPGPHAEPCQGAGRSTALRQSRPKALPRSRVRPGPR